MTPEQALGQGHVSFATDVYGLGATLYEMLAGRPPFQGATREETLAQVINKEPVPPSTYRGPIARDLEAICLRCLNKRPKERYPSASRLRNDLDRFLAGRPTEARPLSALPRAL